MATIYERVDALEEVVTQLQSSINSLENNTADSGWKELPLADGVQAYSEAQKPVYRKIGKTVYMAGVFKGITGNDIVIGTLPEGYRPARKVILPFASIGQKINRMEVLTDGTVRYGRSTIEPTIVENWHSIACSFCTL